MTADLGQINNPLGKRSEYVNHYDKTLLCPISRETNRRSIGITNMALPFNGVDIWNAYELSWLNAKGKPVVAMAEFYFPADSASMVESKSFKLYLNSFNQTRFDTTERVIDRLRRDLSEVSGAEVEVILDTVFLGEETTGLTPDSWYKKKRFKLVDELSVKVDRYTRNSSILTDANLAANQKRSPSRFAYVSHLLKSNCPVTGQPDWATVFIWGQGVPPAEEALLAYIISYREQQDFHEHCVETIFSDIMNAANLKELSVYARYTRRGGLDINPFRSTEPLPEDLRRFNVRLSRQ